MNENIVWTDPQPSGMAAELSRQGFTISGNTVRASLRK